MKHFAPIILFFFMSSVAFSQSLRLVNFYNYDPKLINPAFAGLVDEQNYQVQYKGQGQQYQDFPFTALTSFSLHLKKINSGIGGMYWHSRGYDYLDDNISLLYNYQFKLGDTKRLSVGTELRYSNMKSYIPHFQYGDPYDPAYDPSSVRENFVSYIGVAYQNKKLFLGATAENLVVYKNLYPITIFDRSYNLYAGYEVGVLPWLIFKPSALIRTNFENNYFTELNGIIELNKIFMLGVTTQLGGVKILQKYNAGIVIKKTVQLIAIVYSGVNRYNYSYSTMSSNLELMARVVIKNKPKE